ncbi:hypothetical protein GCM10010116_59770 [Microbispora rosea subsp. aerata]|nr:hypothetical protein GCM10010116_59770 [Microbispora rosea subsp. aerata]GIH58993.1 hypothetical protein Mro02_59070 [Microbispora rosea subsp. aerata]GLJ82125.1 hypothetical protein GCM10017588_08500 [Microbispora rosea subsp. aerata]
MSWPPAVVRRWEERFGVRVVGAGGGTAGPAGGRLAERADGGQGWEDAHDAGAIEDIDATEDIEGGRDEAAAISRPRRSICAV